MAPKKKQQSNEKKAKKFLHDSDVIIAFAKGKQAETTTLTSRKGKKGGLILHDYALWIAELITIDEKTIYLRINFKSKNIAVIKKCVEQFAGEGRLIDQDWVVFTGKTMTQQHKQVIEHWNKIQAEEIL